MQVSACFVGMASGAFVRFHIKLLFVYVGQVVTAVVDVSVAFWSLPDSSARVSAQQSTFVSQTVRCNSLHTLMMAKSTIHD